MFAKILVAVDGSSRSDTTVTMAIDLAVRYEADVTVLHVREYERYEGSDVDMGPPIPAEQLVRDTVERFRTAGVGDPHGEVRRTSSGNTSDQIVDAAEAAGAELIVMGSRGMSEWKSLLLGGVANKVVQDATCPVLLVR